MKTNEAIAMNSPAVTVARVVSGLPERVFAAWTEAGQVEKWFGPPGYKVHAPTLQARVGGKFEFRMQPPDRDDPVRSIVGTYKEVSPPRRLVFTWAWVDAAGSPPDGGESLVTVEFRSVTGGTEVQITHEQLGSEESREGHREGWSGSLQKLAAYLE